MKARAETYLQDSIECMKKGTIIHIEVLVEGGYVKVYVMLANGNDQKILFKDLLEENRNIFTIAREMIHLNIYLIKNENGDIKVRSRNKDKMFPSLGQKLH